MDRWACIFTCSSFFSCCFLDRKFAKFLGLNCVQPWTVGKDVHMWLLYFWWDIYSVLAILFVNTLSLWWFILFHFEEKFDLPPFNDNCLLVLLQYFDEGRRLSSFFLIMFFGKWDSLSFCSLWGDGVLSTCKHSKLFKGLKLLRSLGPTHLTNIIKMINDNF